MEGQQRRVNEVERIMLTQCPYESECAPQALLS
jgi:hypothetical protein